jgi:hypothetical protein
VDNELQLLEDALTVAEDAFREHRLSGFVAWVGDDPSERVGRGAASPLGNPAWWARYRELGQRDAAARASVEVWFKRHGPAS